MDISLSQLGEKLCAKTGILELMDDLGRAMAGGAGKYMLGGGNPAAIPGVQAVWRRRMEEILASGAAYEEMLTNYDTPQGRPAFIESLVHYLNSRYGWNLGPENIAITNGSQSAFFYLFNMLAGEMPDGSSRKILLPITPEYIGYADQGICSSLFQACRPGVEERGSHRFKYHIDFSQLELNDDIGLVAVSRPTNPSGNVLTDSELQKLSELAKAREIPLLIDNAYGAPFPGIIFSDVDLIWEEHIILSLSLSKLGLPGTRTGIVVAAPEIIQALSSINAIAGLANGNVGQEIVAPLLAGGEIDDLCERQIKPFYANKASLASEMVEEYFDDDLPYRLHETEGALFFWLWLKDLPGGSMALYERLKERNVIVVPGDYFFFGLENDWQQSRECLRINYTQPEETVREGLRILADEVRSTYSRHHAVKAPDVLRVAG